MSTYQARKEAANKGNFSHIKLLATSALTAAGLMAASPSLADYSKPTDGTVTHGSATTTQNGNVFETNQNGDTITEYRHSLSLEAFESWYITAKKNGALSAHIIKEFNNDPSRFLGLIKGNVDLLVVDPNGVFFGRDSRVDVNALVVTTGSISKDQLINSDFGDYTIEGANTGEIGLNGVINVSDAGIAAFVAPTVKNAGIINAKIGKVAFAAGEEVAIDLYGDGLFEVVVEGALADAYLENTGEINAAGGTVQMTALAAKDVADNIINLDGVVDVSSATQRGGKIVLSGGNQGTVTVSGKLDASGKDGGEITIDAANTLTTASSEIIADGEDEAGHIVLWGRENALYAGDISALGENGFVETSGGKLGVWGNVNLSAGGEWLLDPTDITIVNGSGNTALLGDLTSDVFFSPDDDGPDAVTASPDSLVWIGDDSINAALNNGVNVTFETNVEGVNDGSITVRADADILKTGGADSTLTFRAHDDIFVHGSIGASGAGKLSVVLTADHDGSGGDSNIVINEQINLNGGDFDATAPGDFSITALGAVNVNGGDVTIDQDGVFANASTNNITTHSGGKITLNQNVGGSINNAIASILNGGNGKNTVKLGEGTFAESVVVDRAVDVVGKGKNKTLITPTSGNGFTIDGSINGDIAISKLAIDGGSNGVKVETTTVGLDKLKLNKLKIENADNAGVSVFGNSVNATAITNSDFKDNGALTSLNKGQGDILFYKHSGDIKIKNVTIEGNTGDVDYGDWNGVAAAADYGIQIFGNIAQPSGEIELDNVNVSGNYRAALLGVQQHDTADITMTDVVLGGTTSDSTVSETGFGGAMFLSELSGDTVNIGNTTFTEITNKDGDLGQYIVLGVEAGSPDVDATGATFEGVFAPNATAAQSFAIEDKVTHKMDYAPLGLVTWKEGELFVTGSQVAANPAAGIQGAINIASAGDTVNVDSATYIEDLTIDKALKLTGHGTTLQSAGGANLITVTAADVNIDPFSFDGLGTALYGINATGADNLVIDGNSFTGFVTANANVTNSKNVSVKNNTMVGAEKGVNGDNVENIKIFDNTITGTTVAGIHVANSDGTGYDGGGKDIDIWGNTVTSAAGTGILVQNSAFATIGADALNPFASGLTGGNKVSGGTEGIAVEGSDNAQIIYSTIDGVGGDGINVSGTADAKILNNIITAAGDDGIGVELSSGTQIIGNQSTGSTNSGIETFLSGNNTIQGNTVHSAGLFGIHSRSGTGTTLIDGNTINNTGNNGIHDGIGGGPATLGTTDLTISNNFVGLLGGVNNIQANGIYVSNSNGAVIDGNHVNEAKINGIYVKASDDAVVDNNTINGAGIWGNILSGPDNGTHGIFVADSDRTKLRTNTITNSAQRGIWSVRGTDIKITDNNNIDNSGLQAIATFGVDDVTISGNTGTNSGGQGIAVVNVDTAVIDNNTITTTTNDGVFVAKGSAASNVANNITISNNTVSGAGDNGVATIDVSGLNVSGNTIDNTTDSGIEIRNSGDAQISGNFIGTGAGSAIAGDGIAIHETQNTTISNNEIDNVAKNGVHFHGDVNGKTIILSKNTITATGNGILFDGDLNAADIDISGKKITAGEDGIHFAKGTRNGTDIDITNVKTRAGDDGIDIALSTRVGSTVDITGGSHKGDDSGIELGAIQGTVTIKDSTIVGKGETGIELQGNIRGLLDIEGGSITGKTDGIGSNPNNPQDGAINGGTLKITNVDITGKKQDAVETGSLFNGGKIDITGGTFNAGKNGVQINGGIVDGKLNVAGTTINAGKDGIQANLAPAPVVALAPVVPGTSLVNISGTTIDAGEDGIDLSGVDTTIINGENSITAGHDGIRLRNFGQAWISYNDIYNTGDDGIDARNGDFISIYDNYIELSGYESNAPGFGNTEVGDGADGIHVENIGNSDGAPIPAIAATAGPGGSLYGSAVEIYNNDVANVEDDGIQVEDSKSAYISNNIVGHAGDDGVDIDDVETTIIRDNKISSVEDKGITIDGGEVGRYAGVFDNRVLLTGNDGISVHNVYGSENVTTLGDAEYGYGWSVNVSGNEVAMTGNDGIDVGFSGPTKVRKNKVFMAGMGKDLESTIDTINTFASLSFALPPIPTGGPTPIQGTIHSNGNAVVSNPNGVVLGANGIHLEPVEPASFDWTWGEGSGINVHNVSDAYNSPNGWAADIRDNKVKYTGGHGIEATDNDRTRIKNNKVRYAGLDATTFNGADSMLDLLSEGPFHRNNPGRRDLWASEGSMITVLDNYIGRPVEEPEDPTYDNYITLSDIEYSNHDGIHASDIYGQYFEGISGGSYLYDLKIKNNVVKHTGDDGIEVDGAGRTLIAKNTIRDAGYGDIPQDDEPGEYYGAGDYDGADGIHVSGVSATVGGRGPVRAPGSEPTDGPDEEPEDLPVHEQSYDYEPDENYAVVIRNNDIKRTGDDGIEVVGSGEVQDGKFGAPGLFSDGPEGYYGTTDRALIAENTIRKTGYQDSDSRTDEPGREHGYSNVGEDGYGHDGIHVRNVTGTFYENPSQKEGPGGSYNAYNSFYGYAVDIIKNDIAKTGDDGVEVFNSESTLIANNTILQAGVKDKTRRQQREDLPARNTDGADYSGADGISVRNVGGSNPDYGTDGYAGPVDFEPYSVAIVNNDVRETADDGIEVVGEFSVNDWEVNSFIQSDVWDDDEAYQYDGTGRTLILANTVRDAGVSGKHGYSYSYDYDSREGSDYSNDSFGNQGSHDGFGGDGISVRGVGIYQDTRVPTFAATSGTSGGDGGGSDYAVQIIDNDVRRTGDDGIEVVGNDYNSKFGASGIGAPVGRVLVSGNFVKKAGLSGGTYRSTNYDYYGSDEGGRYSGNGYSDRTTYFGNAGDDGYGADGIHVRGVGASYEGIPVRAPGSAGEEGGNYYGYAVDVIDNTIRQTGDDGIEVRNSDSALIAHNNVKKAGMLGGEASSSRYRNRNNENGYRNSSSSRTTWSGGSQHGDYTGGDGIHVENVGTQDEFSMYSGISAGNGFEEYAAVVYRNKVKNSADDGVEVLRSGRTRIEKNKIFNSGLASYIGYDEYTDRRRGSSSRSGMITVGARAFDGRGSDGIHVSDVYAENVYYTDFRITDTNSFEPPRIDSVEIVGNKIDNSADDGIQVVRSGDTLIGGENFRLNRDEELVNRDANIVSNSGTGTSFGDDDGPRISAIRTLDDDSGSNTETYEYGGTGEIDATGGDGINVSRELGRGEKGPKPRLSIALAQQFPFEEETQGPSTQIRIIGNQVSDSADDGIEVDTSTSEPRYIDTTNVLIDTNDVINSGDNGIALVTGGFAGSEEEFSVSFVAPFGGRMNSETIGNTVENSGNNGLLAGGYNHDKVVVSDNTFTNNPTGARFESGEVDLTGDANTFTVTSDFATPEGFDFVTGMQFELAGSISQPTSLTVKDDTLGSTVFQGYGNRPVGQSYYVRVEDGALLEENGAPTIIDGTFANWDGLVPNSQGNILSLQQLIDLESRIFDADDPALNGRGQIFVGTVPGLNPEDFLQDRGFGQFGTSGLNIIVTGLPSTGGPSGANFNDITPAAGDGEEGDSPEELANIEPAAGGEEAVCWGDAIDAASSGGTVSYSFGGSLEEAIADASSCGSGSL